VIEVAGIIGVTDYCITRSYERVKAEKDKGRLIFTAIGSS
jgi:hypothetical protein